MSFMLLALLSCKQHKTEKSNIQTVQIDTVRIYGESKSVTFPGKVTAASDINLAFRIGGPISHIYVDAGKYVKKGQQLAEIDARDYKIQLAATEAEYNRLKAEAERVISLYKKGSIAPNEYDKAVYGLKQITAKYEAHKNALTDTKLYAPCDGYIQKRLFEPGETVSAGLPVLSMISASTDEIEINIPSSDYIRRDNFESYYCVVDIYPGKSFPLKLIGITRKANMNQLYTMRLRLTGNEKEKPGPGMSTMVTIKYKNEEAETVSIPLTSIFELNTQTMVWVYNRVSETISARNVKVSEILHNGKVIISFGLSHGEIVVSRGVNSVKEGEKVKLLPRVSPTNIGGML
ncbi:efflux RND transporter periplasmic adaptor subunit [Bacteroides sp. 224]|nr:efflux RND transporter periplasmic adaptor subunit [Bacteroides sp. 224]